MNNTNQRFIFKQRFIDKRSNCNQQALFNRARISHRLRMVSLGLLSSVLLACGGGSSGGSNSGPDTQTTVQKPASMTVSVSGGLGQMRNLDVRLLDLDGVNIVDPVAMNDDGIAVFEIPSTTSEIIVECAGDADAEYFDEAIGAYVPFDEGNVIRAALSSPQSEIGCTSLTEIAVSHLEATNGGIYMATAESINQSNELVRRIFFPGLEDITLAPTVVGPATSRSLSIDSVADQYGMFLAAIAELGSFSSAVIGAPALYATQALAEDMRDGVLDALHFGNPLSYIYITTPRGDFSLPQDQGNTLFDFALTIAVGNYGDQNFNVLLFRDLVSDIGDVFTGVWNLSLNGTTTVMGQTFTVLDDFLFAVNLPASIVPGNQQEAEDFVNAGSDNVFDHTGLDNVRVTSIAISESSATRVVVVINGTASQPGLVTEFMFEYIFSRN